MLSKIIKFALDKKRYIIVLSFYFTIMNIYLNMLKRITFITITVGVLFLCKEPRINADDYEQEYSYNIISAETWDVSPYVWFGYSFGWVPYFNSDVADYGSMLRNGHSGFIIGAGMTINGNWQFGLSFQRLTRSSNLRSYEEIYPEISGIKSEVLMTNIDVALKFPFTSMARGIKIHVVSGFNIITANLTNVYRDGYDYVPAGITKTPHRASLGANVGLSLSWKLFAGVYVKAECRRMFILTRSSSLIDDSWLFNTGISLNF